VLLANRRDVLYLRRAALGKWPYVVIFELVGARNGMAVNEAVEALTIKDPLLLPEFRSWWARGWALRGRKPLWGLGFEGL
jgi:hypothetical protein